MQPKWILFQKKKQKKRNKGKNIFASPPIPCLHTNIVRLRLHVKATLIHYVVSLYKPFPSVACSRRSDSGERCDVKGSAKK